MLSKKLHEIIDDVRKLLYLLHMCRALAYVTMQSMHSANWSTWTSFFTDSHRILQYRCMRRVCSRSNVELSLTFARSPVAYASPLPPSTVPTHPISSAVLTHTTLLTGWDYPMHLGVTEAGEGEDGRMKSAIGIGSLLADGLGVSHIFSSVMSSAMYSLLSF